MTGARLHLCYDRYPDHLRVTVRGAAPALWPEQDELGWEMLRAIIGDVHAEVVDGVGILTLIEPLRDVRRCDSTVDAWSRCCALATPWPR